MTGVPEGSERLRELIVKLRECVRYMELHGTTGNIELIREALAALAPPAGPTEKERQLEWVLDRAEEIVRYEHGKDAAYAFTQAWGELPKELQANAAPPAGVQEQESHASRPLSSVADSVSDAGTLPATGVAPVDLVDHVTKPQPVTVPYDGDGPMQSNEFTDALQQPDESTDDAH